MLHGFEPCELEVRAAKGGSRVSGNFPYGSTATLSDGGKRGRPRKERFGKRAFQYSVESPDQEIHLLVGHDFGQPLASKLSGSLKLTDSDKGLFFDALIPDAVLETSHGRDVMGLLSAGLVGGISPGFRIPPEQTVPNAETVEEEDPSEGRALIRTINQAVLYELSLVTRPAYDQTQVEARTWDLLGESVRPVARTSRYRWRL